MWNSNGPAAHAKHLLCVVVVLLAGCVTTQTPVDPSLAASAHTVKVQIYRAADGVLSEYTLDQVQTVLAGTRQALINQGIDVHFEVLPDIRVDEAWEDLYSQDVLRISGSFRNDTQQLLRIFITNKIWSCGGNSYETTVILGCTPVGSPVLVVQGKVNGAADNYGTHDAILWLHEMGHSVQLGHAESWRRVMTPAPRPDSTRLERYEVRQYTHLGERLLPQVVQGAVAAPSQDRLAQPVVPLNLLSQVRQAGLHGLDLTPFQEASDAEILSLTPLLNTSEPLPTQANALAVMGQMGGVASVQAVQSYVRQKPAHLNREVKEAGLIGLAKNERPEVASAAVDWVIQATRPGFWCDLDATPPEQKACQRLVHIAIGALAQSQQPLARAHLKRLAQPPVALRPPSMQDSDGVNLTDKTPPSIDKQWAAQSVQTAQKFFRKVQTQP